MVEDQETAETKQGIVYCLTNPAMPELVKIGRINNNNVDALKRRMNDLYKTGVPVPFKLRRAISVEDSKKTESLLHFAFHDFRLNSKREFFIIDYERVAAAMDLVTEEDISIDEIPNEEITQADFDSGKELEEKENKRKDNFKFSIFKIPIGAELTFSTDSDITAKVSHNNKIEFEGEEWSMSKLARKILNKPHNVQGPLYWEYEGKTLDQIRKEKEEENESENEDT